MTLIRRACRVMPGPWVVCDYRHHLVDEEELAALLGGRAEPVETDGGVVMRITPLARSSLTGKDFISTADWTKEELGLALDVAKELKAAFKAGHSHRLLPDRTLFMIFFDLSTRTRNAFEAGMTQLGGHAHFIDANTSQIAHGETPHDMGIILSSYGHGIAIRH